MHQKKMARKVDSKKDLPNGAERAHTGRRDQETQPQQSKSSESAVLVLITL